MFDVENNRVELEKYSSVAEEHKYINNLDELSSTDSDAFLEVGVDSKSSNKSGTFIQKDSSIIHCDSTDSGVEIKNISKALEEHEWLSEYMWNSISPDKDEFTQQANDNPHEGFFIRSKEGVTVENPVQACLHIAKDGFSQNVHNIVIAEEGSTIHIIAGCSTSKHLTNGLHVGVSEFYVKKGATLKYTMVHDWGEKVNVRPRTVTHVEEGGVFISNYISLKPLGTLQMNPVTYLNGEGAIARFNSVLVASKGTHMDTGSDVHLNAKGAKAEIISRAITTGGKIIAKGKLVGKAKGIKAHLECKGLIINDGILHAIPELEASLPDIEMSHEAAVGKIDPREIEYLMARGLDEDEAISTIVRGFLNVDIEGLPDSLVEKLNKAIADTQNDMI
ncbi:MAG: SufD family Fe-S cluster assembly protein [Desulfobacterales bacterium]|nr:SufD family Fe-S cluster assembly protein [Desulfobacterales bacterium]